MKNSSGILLISVVVALVFLFGLMLIFGKSEPVTLPLIIEEYSDLQCPYCALYSGVEDTLKEEFGDKVQFEFKHFPLEGLHDNAFDAAVASEAAREQGKFKEYHELLFANQDKFEDEDFYGYATELEMDVEKFKNDYLTNESLKQRVKDSQAEGTSRGVSATPTFFINGKKYSADGVEGLFEKVRSLIAKAEK